MTDVTENTELRKSRNGRIGSTARASAKMNAAIAIREPTTSTTLVVESQSNSVPPRLVNSVRPPAPSAMNSAPR